MRRYLSGKTFELTCDTLELSIDSIFEKCDIELGKSTLNDFQFSAEEVGRVFAAIIEEYPGDDIHIKASKNHVGNIYGTGELAFLVSRNLGEALHRMAKMKSWIKPLHYLISNTGDSLKVEVSCPEPSFPMNPLLEIACFIYTIEACRFHSGQQINARHIQITEAVPHQDLIALELGCKINIGKSNALVLDASIATIPLPQTHSFMEKIIDSEIEKRERPYTASTPEIESVSMLAKEQIKAGLIDNCSAGSVAQSLSLSKRTFERRLSQEGTSFRQILDLTRAELALEFLAQPEYTLCEVSYLLGFKEPNSFLRAFKRWHGQTPSEYMRLLQRKYSVATESQLIL